MCTLPHAETLTIEFKSDKKPLPDNDIIDAVVAFANTEGGDLYLGIEDDGTVTGLHPSHQDITRLTAFIANKTVPPVSTRAIILTDKNLQVLKISVPKYTSIVASSTGKIQRRRLKADHTPENVPLYPYEIPHRLSSLSLLDFSAQTLPDTTRHDLDATERARLRNIIRTYHGEPTLLELDDLELDKALRLVAKVGEDYVPTVTGMLLIGRQERLQELIPTAESSLQIMDNGQLRINETYTLPLLASIEKMIKTSKQRKVIYYTFSGQSYKVPTCENHLVKEPITDYADYNQQIMKLANNKGNVTRADVTALLHVSPAQAYRLLNRLKENGLLVLEGKGKFSHYKTIC